LIVSQELHVRGWDRWIPGSGVGGAVKGAVDEGINQLQNAPEKLSQIPGNLQVSTPSFASHAQVN
jgi:hypothetical protein